MIASANKIISCIRILSELVFISLFIYSLTFLNTDTISVLRICIFTAAIFILFLIRKFCLDKNKLKDLLNPTIVFFLVFSLAQTLRNVYVPHGLPILLYEIVHYILTMFVLFYNFKDKKFLETGLVLFIVYSFRIFDLHLADNEFLLIHGLTLILALIWLEAIYAKDKILPRLSTIFAPLIIFMIVAIFSAINAVCPYKSLAQTAVMINFIFIGFLTAVSLKDIKQVNLLLLTFFLIGGALIILAMNEILFKLLNANIYWALNRIWIGKTENGPYSIHANSTAGYFVVLLCLVIGGMTFYKSGMVRLGASFFIIVMLAILGLTYSRFCIFSFMLALTILSAFRYKKFINSVRRKPVFLILSVALIIIIIALSPVKGNIVRRLLDASSSNSTFYSCKITFDAIKDNPLFGAGFENYYLLAKYAPESMDTSLGGVVVQTSRNLTKSAPHSLYLGIAFGSGIIGLLAFIWLSIAFIVYCLRMNNYIDDGYEKGLFQGIFVAFISVIVHGILSMTFHLTVLPAFFWILIGLAIAIGNITNFNKKIKYELKSWQAKASLIMVILISMGIVINPIFAERYYILALNSFNSGNLNQAINKIDRAKKLIPINPAFYDLSAEIQIKQGLIDEAIESYKKALSLRQGYAFYHTKLGQLFQKKGAYVYALREFNEAIILDKYGAYPKEHYSDLGLLYEVLGKKDEAVGQFKKALLIEPEVVRNNSWCGLKYLDELLNKMHQDYEFEKERDPSIARQIRDSLKIIYR